MLLFVHKDLPIDPFGLLMMILLSSSATEGRTMTLYGAEEDFAGQVLVLGNDCFDDKLVDCKLNFSLLLSAFKLSRPIAF